MRLDDHLDIDSRIAQIESIRRARAVKKLSQREVANHCGFPSPQYYALVEAGLRPMLRQCVDPLATLLEINLKSIICAGDEICAEAGGETPGG